MAKSHTTPWTLRAYDAIPGNPIWIGAVFTIGFLVAFFIGRAMFGGADNSAPGELRIAVTQILITAYCATAYAYVLMMARRNTRELTLAIPKLPDQRGIVDRAGKHSKWILPLVGVASYLIIGIGVTNATTPGPTSPWHWQGWGYDVFWHRATTVAFVYWIGCFNYVIVVESARLSRVSNSIKSLDLLNMQPYQPLLRQGLTNALLMFGMVSVLSLLGVESRYWPALIGFWISFTVLAWIGLMLPLRGIRREFRAAKIQELEWCKKSLKVSRDALKSGSSDGPSIADTLAYQSMIENLRNWPFDNSILFRFSLYLLIPLGSWLGGAFVERGVDLILS
ncbi:MAG: hypothetical protein OER91_01490 [Gammaproteobacteria bacterium]|nr:hypothetical protein [Gammaproteobacteria bacterium]